MSEIAVCSIVIPSKLPGSEIEFLENELSLYSIKVQKSPSRVIGVDDIVDISENKLNHSITEFKQTIAHRTLHIS